MTRSPTTMDSPPTLNFRGADVSATAQADAATVAKRLSDRFGSRFCEASLRSGLSLDSESEATV